MVSGPTTRPDSTRLTNASRPEYATRTAGTSIPGVRFGSPCEPGTRVIASRSRPAACPVPEEHDHEVRRPQPGLHATRLRGATRRTRPGNRGTGRARLGRL